MIKASLDEYKMYILLYLFIHMHALISSKYFRYIESIKLHEEYKYLININDLQLLLTNFI